MKGYEKKADRVNAWIKTNHYGITQVDLAFKMGVSQSTLSKAASVRKNHQILDDAIKKIEEIEQEKLQGAKS